MCADGMYCSGTCVNLAKGKGSMGVRAPPPISPVETTSPITKYPSRAATSRNITNPPGVASPITPRNRFGSVDPHHGTIVNTTSRKNDMSPAHRGSGEICQTPGCALPARVVGKYCTGTHKWCVPPPFNTMTTNRIICRLGENGCIFCRTAPTVRSLPFCKPCYSRIVCEAPTIVEVPRDHEKYRAVSWLEYLCYVRR